MRRVRRPETPEISLQLRHRLAGERVRVMGSPVRWTRRRRNEFEQRASNAVGLAQAEVDHGERLQELNMEVVNRSTEFILRGGGIQEELRNPLDTSLHLSRERLAGAK